MRRALFLSMALTLLAWTSPGHAQTDPACENWADLPQQGMNQCAGIAYQAADAKLNAVWTQLRTRRGDSQAWDPILEAQRAWITFRDAHCESLAAPYEGGSIQPLIRFSCLEETTAHRTVQLQDLLLEP